MTQDKDYFFKSTVPWNDCGSGGIQADGPALGAQKVGPLLGLYTHVQVAVDEYIHIHSTREFANRFHWNINCVKMNVFRNGKKKSIV